jgi:hypothetical protein
MGMGSALSGLDGIDKNLGICLHAILYNVGFFIFMWMSVSYKNGDNSRLATAAIGTVILAVIYAVVMVALKLIPKAIKAGKRKSKAKKAKEKTPAAQDEKNVKKAKKAEKAPYTNQFS